jgi:hypothetical protein
MGLEDNPDFWDMGIDDGGEEIMAIKDLTKHPSLFFISSIVPCHLFLVHLPENSDFNVQKANMKKFVDGTLPIVLEAPDSKPVKPQRLPNGNYQYVRKCFQYRSLPLIPTKM